MLCLYNYVFLYINIPRNKGFDKPLSAMAVYQMEDSAERSRIVLKSGAITKIGAKK